MAGFFVICAGVPRALAALLGNAAVIPRHEQISQSADPALPWFFGEFPAWHDC
jgi:hypothetical protein